jgi:tetratricopeptide (TPR) repeat protein
VNAAPQVMRPVAAQGPIVRMAEHGRVWELELPESSGAYELQIPLAGRPLEAQTRADQELLGKTQPEKKSYLGALARISDLFEHHRYELALIETADLETAYPDEARLQAMKGSLYQKLGKNKLAREAWKRALEIEPSNTSVVQALRELGED